MPELKKYRVTAGIHYHQNPDWLGKGESGETPQHKIFKKGDILESSVDLCAGFENHFELVRENEYSRPATPERKKQVEEVLQSGGVWTEKDREFLEGLSDRHFENVARQNAPKSTQDASGLERVQPPTKDASGASRPKITSNLGNDVTDQFQQAHDNGFTVFATKGGKHQVTSRGSEKPLNPKPLAAEEVEKFVEQYMKESK